MTMKLGQRWRLAEIEREMAELHDRIWAGEIEDDPSLGKRHAVLSHEAHELRTLIDLDKKRAITEAKAKGKEDKMTKEWQAEHERQHKLRDADDPILDAFNDSLVEVVAEHNHPTHKRERIPNWPKSPPPPEVDITAPNARPIQPFNQKLADARRYDGKIWDDPGYSYFRDKLLVAEENQRVGRYLQARAEGGEFRASGPPSPIEYRTGGFEGAIARFSEAALSVERRSKPILEQVQRAERARGHRGYTISELRAMNTGTQGVGLVPQNGVPLYISELFADAARTKARFAPRLFQGELPPFGMQVVVGKTTTGTAVAVQTAEAAAPQNTDAVTTTATSAITTIAGYVDVSRQLFDRDEVQVDEYLAGALGRSFGAVLEAQVINGSGASGQLTGLLGVSGISSVSYADASPTQNEAWNKVQELLSTTGTAAGAPVDTLVMHTRRAAWLRGSPATQTPPALANIGAEVIDTNGVPTTLGGGTEDAVLALALQETPVFVGPINFQVQPDVGSGTLVVRCLAFAYVALVGARLPASIGKLTGTGLIAPTF